MQVVPDGHVLLVALVLRPPPDLGLEEGLPSGWVHWVLLCVSALSLQVLLHLPSILIQPAEPTHRLFADLCLSITAEAFDEAASSQQ